MTATGAEPGIVKAVIGALSKPFELIITPIAERIGAWLRRKPRLHIHFLPLNCYWNIATQGDTELMQIRLAADFAHDGLKESLIIADMYPKGTRSWKAFDQFMIRPGDFSRKTCVLFVRPIIAEKGKDWTGRLVLVDQFKRKYKSDVFRYTWVGPAAKTAEVQAAIESCDQ